MEAVKHFSDLEKAHNQLGFSEKLYSYIVISENLISIFGKNIDYNSNADAHLDVLKELLNGIASSSWAEKKPDAVLIDIPFNEKYFEEFFIYFKSRIHFQGVLFFWNSNHLSVSEMLNLVETGRADDFFEDILDMDGIENKTSFLLKYKYNEQIPKLLQIVNANLVKEENKSLMLIKRFFDIVVSLGLLVFFTPLFILVALAIKIESRGPIFYISNRVGRHYKIFPMIKFRSMQDGADKYLSEVTHLNMYGANHHPSSFVKIKNDPRVSIVGKFLRKTSIDEFPQLLNVLMGHMSIVGNRPLPLYEAEKLLVNEYVKRFDAPAGITGLWQVVKKDKPEMDEEERINLDIRYSNEWDLLKDFWILVKTPSALLQNQNY